MARIASFQASNGHFSFWGGTSPIETFTTPYVVDFMLDAREEGFAVPQDVLQKSMKRLNDDLLAGGHPYYEYEQHDHLRIADEAWSGFVLARVNRAPLGTLRAIFDNERGKLVAPLPLVHLGIALKLMGDNERAQKADRRSVRLEQGAPVVRGRLRLGSARSGIDGVAHPPLRHEQTRIRRQADRLGTQRDGEHALPNEQVQYYHWSWSYLSTQEQMAIAQVARAFDAGNGAPLAASLERSVARVEAGAGGCASVSRATQPGRIQSGVSVQPTGNATVFARWTSPAFHRKRQTPMPARSMWAALFRHRWQTVGR